MRISHWKLILIVMVCCLAFVHAAAAFQVNWSLYKSESQIPNVPSFENVVPDSPLPKTGIVTPSGLYPISVEDAKEKIRHYTGQPKADPMLYYYSHLPIGDYYRMYVNLSEFAVNQQTGDIEFVHYGENVEGSSMVNLSRDEALAAAQDYTKKMDPDYAKKNWTLVRDGLYHYWWSDYNQYYFTWREVKDNIRSPSVVHVAVNPHNGRIIDFWDVERTINVRLKPSVSDAEALETAEDYYTWLKFTSLEDEYLTVVTRDTNVQTLVYNVRMGGIYHSWWSNTDWHVSEMLFVDAQNADPISYWSYYYWPEDWIGF
jgi:hypothetical protein